MIITLPLTEEQIHSLRVAVKGTISDFENQVLDVLKADNKLSIDKIICDSNIMISKFSAINRILKNCLVAADCLQQE